MPGSYPTVAQLMGSLIHKGYAIKVYKQSTTDKYAVVVSRDDEPKLGVTMEALNTRMLTAALIKIKRKIEAY